MLDFKKKSRSRTLQRFSRRALEDSTKSFLFVCRRAARVFHRLGSLLNNSAGLFDQLRSNSRALKKIFNRQRFLRDHSCSGHADAGDATDAIFVKLDLNMASQGAAADVTALFRNATQVWNTVDIDQILRSR